MNWWSEVWAAVWQACLLRAPDALGQPGAVSVALGVALFAAVSTELGQLAVFNANRVRGWRLVLGMALGALANAGLRALMGIALGLIALAVSGDSARGEAMVLVYLFATAPHVLGVFSAIPYLGLGFARLLEGWTLLAMAAILGDLLGRPWVALAIAASVWLIGQLLSRVLAQPFSVLASRAWTLLTGRPTVVTANDILSGAPMIPLQGVPQ